MWVKSGRWVVIRGRSPNGRPPTRSPVAMLQRSPASKPHKASKGGGSFVCMEESLGDEWPLWLYIFSLVEFSMNGCGPHFSFVTNVSIYSRRNLTFSCRWLHNSLNLLRTRTAYPPRSDSRWLSVYVSKTIYSLEWLHICMWIGAPMKAHEAQWSIYQVAWGATAQPSLRNNSFW